VEVWLAIGDDEHLVALEILAQDPAQRGRAPGGLAFVPAPALGLQVAHQRLEVAGDGPQGSRRLRPGGAGCTQRFAGNQRLDARHPPAPAQLRDHHSDERDDCRDRSEQVEHILLRILAAPLDEAHVVQDHQTSEGLPFVQHRADGQVHQASVEVNEAIGSIGRGWRRARHRLRECTRGVPQGAAVIAEPHSKHALVPHQMIEVARNLLL
jgi:hypothetical protein